MKILLSILSVFVALVAQLDALQHQEEPIDYCLIELSDQRIECSFLRKANRAFFNGDFFLSKKRPGEEVLCLVVPREPLPSLDIEFLINWAGLKYEAEKHCIRPLQKLPSGIVKGYDIDCRRIVYHAFIEGTHESWESDAPEFPEYPELFDPNLGQEVEVFATMEGCRYIILCTSTRPILLIGTVSFSIELEHLLLSLQVSYCSKDVKDTY